MVWSHLVQNLSKTMFPNTTIRHWLSEPQHALRHVAQLQQLPAPRKHQHPIGKDSCIVCSCRACWGPRTVRQEWQSLFGLLDKKFNAECKCKTLKQDIPWKLLSIREGVTLLGNTAEPRWIAQEISTWAGSLLSLLAISSTTGSLTTLGNYISKVI